VVLGLLVNILAFNLDGFNRLNPSLQSMNSAKVNQPAEPLSVARALYQVGVSTGGRIGVIGDGFNSFWARLAHVRIVAEMLDVDADGFWLGDQALRQNVLQAFASTGVDAVVAEDVPGYAGLQGWHQVENSNYYIYVFRVQ
jgi:hypothetical protein